ncbi:MAG: biopolymer transporter ExbD [Novosphingobium sp.]
MAMSGGNDDGEPMMEMNTTPLIDVMLVLLIMFIITIPVATHSVDIDLPPPSPPTNVPPPNQVKNKLSINRENQIVWQPGAAGSVFPLTQSQLVATLQQTKDMNPEPELQFQPEAEASYDLSAKVLRIIKATGVTKFGFVGNEQYSEFDRAKGSATAK